MSALLRVTCACVSGSSPDSSSPAADDGITSKKLSVAPRQSRCRSTRKRRLDWLLLVLVTRCDFTTSAPSAAIRLRNALSAACASASAAGRHAT